MGFPRWRSVAAAAARGRRLHGSPLRATRSIRSSSSSSESGAREDPRRRAFKDVFGIDHRHGAIGPEDGASLWQSIVRVQGLERDSKLRPGATAELWRLRRADPGASQATEPGRSPPLQQQRVGTKRMRDSRVQVLLPFASDPRLADEYTSLYGHTVRVGMLLEDLDALAGAIAYRHCDDGDPTTPPLMIMTASVDRIDLGRDIAVSRDLAIYGNVTWVGRSSMEVTLMAEDALDQTPLLAAAFTMVARSPNNESAHEVNRLELATDAEKQVFEEGAHNTAKRREYAAKSLSVQPPDEEERLLTHKIFLDAEARRPRGAAAMFQSPWVQFTPLDESEAWIGCTAMESTRVCQPQDRNINNHMFGGYLMREAFELAWANASVFSQGLCTPLASGNISFRKPVEIGSILNYRSRVVYSEGAPHTTFQVDVRADVLDPLQAARDTTNVFSFTFRLDPARYRRYPPRVLPRTYEEAMAYVEGLRRHRTGKAEGRASLAASRRRLQAAMAT